MAKKEPCHQILGDDAKFLREKKRPYLKPGAPTVSLVDLFCGCGGITLGFVLAAHDLGLDLKVPLAVDFEPAAIACYKANFPDANAVCEDVSALFEDDWCSPLSSAEKELKNKVGSLDFLVGGPPCQGHSDLNNYTRRQDPKNKLMQVMVRAAVVFEPASILIENVTGSLRDRAGVVSSVEDILQKLGYKVTIGILDFSTIGVPQRRKRMILVATRGSEIDFEKIQDRFSVPERSVRWAIEDLKASPRTKLIDKIAKSQAHTQKRIDYLFDNRLFELPNEQRPPCHRDKSHSYDTIYGRLRWDGTAQTITSGFYCMCMGRYVHPEQRRTLTAHEAARIQFFPDFFDFSPAQTRTKLAVIIGNAVPPKAAYAVAHFFISSLVTTKC
jgi:DNA (cytosine-5)-methyltransferase 1